ncbi:mycobactin polyketide synthase MbtD [Mycobacterium botniense]|uniref:Polyketide synthase n=1 Tax=Mycobacterium botniense TaxID=84962 RepID=A0A7I9XZX0_9MYCO|nr:mycobactin polyketide synthase MbtD [Mycobacterium botniense]GFG75366.1 polyketide synthase [Mycobacterium botniense]
MCAYALPDGRTPVLLSAHEQELIRHDAAAILDYLRHRPSVGAVASTLVRTRRVRRHRAVVRAADGAELAAGLQALVDGHDHPLVAKSSNLTAPRSAYVFPGQGNQWPAMGAEAYRLLPAYRAEADRCAAAFTAAAHPSPLPYLVEGGQRQWSQREIQAAQFTHAVSLAQVWRSCGILPDITVGHSLGEVAAAYVAGAVALADAVAVVAARAIVVGELPGQYGMAVLGLSIGEVEQLIAEAPGWLEISVVNADSSIVVSGEREAVAAIARCVEDRGAFARLIDVDFPAHTRALESLRGRLSELLPRARFSDSPVEFICSTRGDTVFANTDFTDYWYENLRSPVRFDRAVAAALQRGASVFIEMSAHPSLLYALTTLADDALIVGSARRDEPILEEISASIANVAVADPGYRWAEVADAAGHRPLPEFPNAPMRAIRLWAAPEPLTDDTSVAPLTVAVEEWSRSRAPSRPADSCGGIAILGCEGANAPSTDLVVQPSLSSVLSRRLSDAVEGYPKWRLVSPAEADVVVVIAPALTCHDVATVAEEIIARAGNFVDYATVVGPRCRRVWLVTVGGERVEPGETVVLPAQAALGAMHRSIGFEFAESTFARLDLPDWKIDGEAARLCIDTFVGETATEVALRAGGAGLHQYVRTLRELSTPAPEPSLGADELDNVVITGGNGVIGLHYARRCIELGARRVILLSRKGVDRADLDRLVAGRAVQVHAPVCDITDPNALARAAAAYAGDGASLLVHAAGVGRFGPHNQLTDVDLAEVFGAKVIGLARVIEFWPLRHDVRILLCSSISGVWGGYGHSAYAAANRMLDIFAAQLRAKGLDCTAVRWGLWQNSGIAGADEISRIERSGLVAMDAQAAINASLQYRDDPLVFAADFDRVRVLFEGQGIPLPFTGMQKYDQTAETGDAIDGTVTEAVRIELAAVLSLGDPDSVDLSAALVDLGVDSLLALDLRRRLGRRTGRSVPLARLLSGVTGAQLIEALQTNGDSNVTAAQEARR